VKPYAVEVSFTLIVMSESPEHAEEVAEAHAIEAMSDTTDPYFGTPVPITNVNDLTARGWTEDCIPYGGEGNTCLGEIIAQLEPEPVRDTRTIDMFEDAKQ